MFDLFHLSLVIF